MTEPPDDVRPPTGPWEPSMSLIGKSLEEKRAAAIANYYIQKMVQNNRWRDYGRGWEE
tara:strand:- start:239 stop:412 length:174 start_codon:yes stop_codon:yes gene_type:complete